MTVRPVRPDDVPTVLALVRELAAYERAEHEARMTADQLHTALFGEAPALFGHVAETPDGEVAGFALWFRTFSTWLGRHGIWLEDLFVSPDHRGGGLGKALLTRLAQIAVERGYGRVEWWVLDWNTPSIDFYRSLGAQPQEGWTVYRLDGDALAALGSRLPDEAPQGTRVSRA